VPANNPLKGVPSRNVKNAPKFKGGSAIARTYGVTPTTISQKMRDGWSVERIHAFYQAQGLGGKKGPGRPKLGNDGFKPVVVASVYQGANKHAPKQAAPTATKPSLPPLPSPDDEPDDEPDIPGWVPGASESNDFATLNHAKIRKEVALADKHELDLAERRKELIDRQKVALYFSGMVTRARDTLLRIPSELRDRLAATSNPVECEKLVRKEITQALAVLRDYTLS
jgi:hypothetical protein